MRGIVTLCSGVPTTRDCKGIVRLNRQLIQPLGKHNSHFPTLNAQIHSKLTSSKTWSQLRPLQHDALCTEQLLSPSPDSCAVARGTTTGRVCKFTKHICSTLQLPMPIAATNGYINMHARPEAEKRCDATHTTNPVPAHARRPRLRLQGQSRARTRPRGSKPPPADGASPARLQAIARRRSLPGLTV
jgi:hypothetical protein